MYLTQAVATGRLGLAGKERSIRATNDNGGRMVVVKLKAPPAITIAEIEVFGTFLAELEAASANDNYPTGDAA